MRRRFAIGVAIACGSAVSLGVACSSSDDSASATDAGTDGAGGDGSNGNGDAKSSDAGTDANGPGPVTVLAMNPYYAQPISGVVVVFYDPSGTPQAPLTTGADGKVTATVAAGSSVTTSSFDGSSYSVTTFLGIEPGDSLTAIAFGTGSPAGLGNLTYAAPSGDGGSVDCYISDLCSSTVYGGACTGGSLPINRSCSDGGSVGALALESRGGGTFASYAEAANIPVADGGGANLAAWSWSPLLASAITVSGTLPPNAQDFVCTGALRAGTYLATSGYRCSPNFGSGTLPPFSIALPAPGGFIDNDVLSTSVEYLTDDAASIVSFGTIDTIAAPGDALSVALSSLPAPIHAGVATYDTGTNIASITWTEDGPQTGLVGTTIGVDWTNDGGFRSQWFIVAPPGTSVTLPKLTTDLVPAPPSSLRIDGVMVQGGDFAPTYAAYRAAFPAYSFHVTGVNYAAAHGRVVSNSPGEFLSWF